MKKFIYTFFAISLLTISACTDLDLEPKNTLLETTAFTEEGAYTSYLAKLYASFTLTGQEGPAGAGDISIITDEGFSSYLRAYWKAQELTTDAAVIRWTDAGIQDLNTHSWSSDNQFVRVMYYRIYYTVSLCNDFLRVSTPERLSENNISAEFQNEVSIYRAEARFVRALAYWHGIDLFRNISLITTIGTDLPSQVPPQTMYDFIIGELDAIIEALPETNQYGRADKATARMLRAKVKLNAPNYLGDNAPQNIYNDVVEDLNYVIGRGYSLEPEYLNLFKADNDGSAEIIWAMSQDGINSQSWGATTFMVRAMIFEEPYMTATDYGVVSGWSGVRTTPEFVRLFEVSPDVLDTADSRNVIITDGRTKSTQDDILGIELGYLMPKYSNVTSDGADGSNADHVDTDYPYFRLGDAYLMYAEAVLRGATNGDRATALGYINQLRERAFGDNSRNITDADLTLDFILDERGRELYYEASRRIDLIRFNKFSSRAGGDEMIWEWKGFQSAGTSIPEFREIFPIPASDLGVNPNLRQNPGY